MTALEINLFTLWAWLQLTPARCAKMRYYARNVEVCKSRATTHRRSEKGKAWMRKWMNARRAANPQFKLRQVLSARVWWALKNAGANKTASTLDLLGVAHPEQVWGHLESRFQPGMTRENYGSVWEIDHKRPCASFDLTDPAQQRECFHYRNLQPLFVADNRSKGAKYAGER